MSACLIAWWACLLCVGDQRKDHPVEIVEEADEVEAELDEALLFVRRERAEDFCCVERVVLVHDFVDIERDQRCIEEEGDPLPAEQEEEGERCVCSHLGEDKLQVTPSQTQGKRWSA